MGASPDAVEAALKLIQRFRPAGRRGAERAGVPAASSSPRNAEPDPVSVEIVERHFEDLERRRYAEIARALKLPLEWVMESIEEIQSLEPKPGRRFSINDSRYVVPDVTIQKVGDDYVVILNEEGIPRLRVNSLDRRCCAGRATRPSNMSSRSCAARCGSSRAWSNGSARCEKWPRAW